MDIKAFFIFSGPSIVNFKPSARVLLSGQPHPSEALTNEHWHRAVTVLQPLLTAETKHICDRFIPSLTFAELFADAVLLLQQIFRHPMQQRLAPRSLNPETVEVVFTLAKEHDVEEILQCALILVNFVATQDSMQKQSFAIHFQKARKKAAFKLADLFLYDRLKTAWLLGVPIQRESGPRVFLGQGQHTQLMSYGYTTLSSRLGKALAGDKARSARLLSAYGLPVPKQYSAYNEHQAISAAQTIGYPVVLKPRSGRKGRAVAVHLNSDDDVRAAFRQSVKEVSDEVVVETFVHGDDYRLLVVGDRMIAAVKRIPAMITGDGVSNIETLMELSNKHLQRDGLYLFPLKVDAEVRRLLAEQHLQLDSIPGNGVVVRLRAAANQSLGGTTLDVTDLVHPDNCAMAVAAARAIMLDVAGIDFVTEDITRSWREGFGGIVEINAGPGVDLHMCPTAGIAREVSWHMIRKQFPADCLGRIPVVMVTGKYHKTATVHCIERLLALTGYSVGLSAKDGVFVRGRMIATAGHQPNVKQLLTHPAIDAAVFEVSMSSLAIEGAPVDRTSITLLTDGECSSSLLKTMHDEHAAPRICKLATSLATHNVIVDASLNVAEEVLAYMPANKVGLVCAKRQGNDLLVKKHLLAGGWVVRIARIGNVNVIVFESSTKQETIDTLKAGLSADTDHDKLREIVFGIATLIGLGHSLNDCKAAIRNANLANNMPSTLQACTINDNNLLAILALYDENALDDLILSLKAKQKTTRILIVLDTVFNNNAALSSLITKIYDERVWFFCNLQIAEKLKKFAIPEYKINYFSCVESAVQAVYNQRSINETIVLFIMDDVQRHILFKHFAMQYKTPQEYNTNTLWNAKELAQIFKGSWVGGSDIDCIFNNIAYRADNIIPGDLVIIPDKYTQANIDIIQSEVKSAIANGAAGVVASLAPIDIPKHYPVLISDDPYYGLHQLANIARSKMQGKIICVIGEKNGLIHQFITNKQKTALNKVESIYNQGVIDAPENQLQMMLSLVKIPRSIKWSLFYIQNIVGYITSLQPDLCIINTEEFDNNHWITLSMMLPRADIVLLCKQDQLDEFTAKIYDSNLHNIRLLILDDNFTKNLEDVIFSISLVPEYGLSDAGKSLS